MSSDPAATAPMPDERPMGVLDEPNEGRALHASLGGVVYARHPVRTHLVTAADATPRRCRPLRRIARRRRAARGRQRADGRHHPGSRLSDQGHPCRAPGAAARALRDAARLRDRARLRRDDGARHPGGRRAAHPARRGGLGDHEAVRRSRRVLSRRRTAGQGDRRPDQLHDPALQPGRHARAEGSGRRGASIAAAIDAPVAIIDANDAGCAVLGASPGIDRRFVERLFADNPLGQAREQTPICVVREVRWPDGEELPPEPKPPPHAAVGAP